MKNYLHNEFLQSEEWAHFQKRAGKKVFGVRTEGLTSKIFKEIFLRNKSFLFVPRGPAGEINEKNLKKWLDKVKEIAKEERVVFVHIEPPWPLENKNNELLLKLGCQKSVKEIEPQSTYLLDISPPAEEIFRNFVRGMRYNINYSEKHGLKAVIKEDGDSINDFLRILESVKNNLDFKPFSENYYRAMGEELLGKIAKIINIEKDGKVISSTIFIFFNKRATALHTFALEQCKKFKCLSFALWHGILHAQSLGCREFDFWGSEDYNKDLQGSAQLKRNFNAYKYTYGNPLDYVIDKKYYFLWKIYKKILKMI